jgi:hypothetical protein
VPSLVQIGQSIQLLMSAAHVNTETASHESLPLSFKVNKQIQTHYKKGMAHRGTNFLSTKGA